MNRFRTNYNYLAYSVVGAALLVVIGAASYVWWDSRQQRDVTFERAYVASEVVALSLNEHAGHTFDMAAGLLDIVDEMVRERGGPAKVKPEMHRALARELYGVENAYQTLLVLDPSGKTLASSWTPAQAMPQGIHEMIAQPFRDNPHYAGIAFSRAFTSAVTGELVVALAKGYHEPEGRLSAVLGVTIRLSHFQSAYDRIRAASGGSQTLSLSLYTLDAYLLARSPPPTVGGLNTKLSARSYETLHRGIADPHGRLRFEAVRDGLERVAVVRRVGDYPFVVGASTTVDDVLAGWRAHTYEQVFSVGFGGLLLLTLAGLLARGMMKLAHSQKLMRLATEGAGVGIWDRDLRPGKKPTRSRVMLSLLGLTPEDPLTKVELLMIELVHPEDKAMLLEFGAKARAHPHESRSLEFRMRHADGSYRWYQSTGVVVEADGEKPLRIAGTLVDVDQRRRAEDEVRKLAAGLEVKVAERTRELEIVVKELESFSYSVSHDLRAPVRHVNAFAKLSLDALEAGDADQARAYAARVMRAGEHMDHVIQHLLMLARVGRTQARAVRMDLSAVANEAVKRLQEGEPERTVGVNVEPGLRAVGDPGLTEVAVENLMSNAWKFTRPRGVNARIEFGLTSDSGAPAFYVRDNGVGFDPGRAERLFQPFTRLHSESEFEGTGIGLATVKRALERQGGTIRAESTPGVGTTIFFTLPQ